MYNKEMRRIQQRPLRRKKTDSQIVTYVVILILLIAFLMTFGLQLILNASRSIAGFGRSGDEVSQTTSEIIVAPVLYDVPDATNSARLALSGSSSGDGVITIYVNDESVEDIAVSETEPDFETVVTLTDDSNVIYAQFKDTRNRVKDSDSYTVELVKQKPTLEITSPADGSTTEDEEITVAGSTAQSNQVKVNGQPIVMNADGSFRHQIRLKEGENILTIVASDEAGNSELEEVRITYEKP